MPDSGAASKKAAMAWGDADEWGLHGSAHPTRTGLSGGEGPHPATASGAGRPSKVLRRVVADLLPWMAQLASPPVRVLLWSLINAESPPDVTCSDGPLRNSIKQHQAVDAPDFAAALEDSENEPLLRRHCVANPIGFEVLDDGVHYHGPATSHCRVGHAVPIVEYVIQQVHSR